MKFLIYFLLTFVVYSCNPIEYRKPVFYYEYFPVELDVTKEYFVLNIVYSSFGTDTNSYFLKETVSEIMLDNQGDTVFRINRFTKSDTLEDYVIKDIWTVKKTNRSIEVVEENERFIKMVFPLNEYLYWNGNAFNGREPQEYYIEKIHENHNLNDNIFDSTVTVIQNFTTNQIEYESAKEVYANETGLIYKENIVLNINNGNLSDVNYGSIYIQELVNH